MYTALFVLASVLFVILTLFIVFVASSFVGRKSVYSDKKEGEEDERKPCPNRVGESGEECVAREFFGEARQRGLSFEEAILEFELAPDNVTLDEFAARKGRTPQVYYNSYRKYFLNV